MTLVSLEVGSADHRGMSGAYETSLVRRLFNYDHLLGRRPTSFKTGASGHLVHLADSALGRWFQEMVSNQFKPDQTGFGRVCVCVCVCVRVRVYVRACLYVCWGEIVLCDRMSAACLSVG